MNRLIMFVKAPVAGKVKTRLCPPFSHEQAARFYRAFAEDTFRLLSMLPGMEMELAYEPDQLFRSPAWIDPNARFFMQEGTDLGARLIHAFDHAFSHGAERVVIIGSDSPGLPPRFVTEAFESLDHHDVALGPSSDGGYYLVGLRRPCPKIFHQIPWSGPEVYRRTMEAINGEVLSVHSLPEFGDVDIPEDLNALRSTLETVDGNAWPLTRNALCSIDIIPSWTKSRR